MHSRDDVKLVLEKLYQEMSQDLCGLEESELVDEILAEKNQTIEEKNQTIEELRTALRAQTAQIKRLKKAYQDIAESLPIRVLRKLGVIYLKMRPLSRRGPDG